MIEPMGEHEPKCVIHIATQKKMPKSYGNQDIMEKTALITSWKHFSFWGGCYSGSFIMSHQNKPG